MAASRQNVLKLYKLLLRESKKLDSYNFRNYALRRVRDAFKENASLKDTAKVNAEYVYGTQQLDVVKRQALISQLYKSERLVIEKQST